VGTETIEALRGVSFGVQPGQFTSIMGASGSGKSTLLALLGCLDIPTSGRYWLGGQEVSGLDRDALAGIRNRSIGYVFQSFHLLPRTTALENVMLPLQYDRTTEHGSRVERARLALESVGLSNRMDHHPNQLSGGQQQRVAIARALVNDPDILLCDEATGNLDSHTALEIIGLFQQLEERGKTIVFVTHERDLADYSARILRLHDGLLVDDQLTMNRQRAARPDAHLVSVGAP
jgi:putative ABC transport system ATP-binding protein